MKAIDKDVGVLVGIDSITDQAAAAAAAALPAGCGFILLVAPAGERKETSHVEGSYASNCNREDAIAMLKTLLFRWGINDEWMKRAK